MLCGVRRLLLPGHREENELGWWMWVGTGGLSERFIAGHGAENAA